MSQPQTPDNNNGYAMSGIGGPRCALCQILPRHTLRRKPLSTQDLWESRKPEAMRIRSPAPAAFTQESAGSYFRDVQVLRHHAFGAESRYETAGRVFLGLAPDLPALAL
jgi:hypothetical protein